MEVWKDIKGYEGLYKVSSYGRVKSIERYKNNYSKLQLVPEKIINISENNKGYKKVNLWKNNKPKNMYIHRLVADSFIENIYNKSQVNHKDGIKGNNKLENLEWVTPSENSLHKVNVLGYKHPKGGKSKLSIKVNQYTLDGVFVKQHGGIREAERSLGYYNPTSIYKVCKGTHKQSLGYIWEYS